MSKQRIILLVMAFTGLILVFTFLAGTWTDKVGEELAAIEPQAAEQVSAVVSLQTEETRQFSGHIQPRRQAAVAARITARVAEVLVESGDRVEQGDVLLRLESDDLSARVRQQQQALAAAQARVNESRSNYQRVLALVEQGLLPAAALDEAVAQRDTAQAQFLGAREALAEAETSASYSVITAPFAGVVSERTVYTGDTATPGTQLVSLYQPKSVRFEAAVSESVLASMQPGRHFQVYMDAHAKVYKAVLTEVVPMADTGSRSFKVRLELQTEEALNPGMYGRLTVPTGTRNIIAVPASSVVRLGQLSYVYVAKQQRLERRLVRLGDTQLEHAGMLWFEVHSGVEVGDLVVVQE
ncbi:efflux RND transporter periplasmic adaptor subunit [Aliidiomarina taiwanensis]|uniref:Efflux RND transporter periplasmic adaptor subunit n=1 Tax=Aliidiomarina taiwanensis TaxID=946228 RepID=A0A432X1U4_9GAMM|nr:efflux RND transporter periplasmic adaptor subunit [Aliidiomarina taiwanensis]RUO40492.1 efflux RND transporter periplasmic adaptor subunit [Aliidiomarina taiwanensis]